MSKACLLGVLVCAFAASSSFARILRVNNNPGISATYKTLDLAYTNARDTDTLHLEGSPTSYGALVCAKNLTILGPGYFLEENPKTQALLATAIVNGITFNSGSEKSLIMGLEFYGGININANSITIKRNKFIHYYLQYPENYTQGIYIRNQLNGLPVNDIIISQNYGVSIEVSNASSAIYIFNNYLTTDEGAPDYATCLKLNPASSAIVQNNIFRRGTVIASVNSPFTNNIMVSGIFSGAGTLVTNNISNNAQFGTANGNKSADMNTVFVGIADKYSDAQWKLKEGSPAKSAGFGSTPQNPVDAGIYSGPSPYVLSGMPPIPSIYFFTTTPIGSNAIPLKAEVSVKSGG